MTKREKLAISMCILAISTTIFTGCGKKDTPIKQEDTYLVEGVTTEYRGYFVSKNIESVDCTELTLMQENATHVEVGSLVASKEYDVLELEKLQAEKQSYESKLANVEQQIEQLNNGDITNCKDIKDSLNEIIAQISELDYTLSENELSRKENELNYQNRISQLDKTLQNATNSITALEQKKTTQTEETVLQEIEQEINQLNQTITEANNNKEYEAQEYSISEDRINLSNEKINQEKVQLQSKYNELSNASSSNSTIKSVLEGLNSERDLYVQKIEELSIKISKYENSKIVAPFDAQIEIEDNNIIFYSEEKVFVFKATENQMKSLTDENTSLKVTVDEYTGNLSLASCIYDKAVSELGNEVYYELTYNVEWNNMPDMTTLLYGNSGIMKSEPAIFIPQEYVEVNNNKYYVIVNDEKKEVNLKESNGIYKVINGVNIGDELKIVGDELD